MFKCLIKSIIWFTKFLVDDEEEVEAADDDDEDGDVFEEEGNAREEFELNSEFELLLSLLVKFKCGTDK